MKKRYISFLFMIVLFSACDRNRILELPTVSEAVKMANDNLNNEKNNSIFDASKLIGLDTAVFFEGNFSPGKKKEVIAMCFASKMVKPCNTEPISPPPFETSNYLFMKLTQGRGSWVIDWVAQENPIQAQNIVDIDNDKLSELVFEGSYYCKGGMRFGYYYILTFKNDNAQIIYQKVSENQLATWPNPKVSLYKGAVLIDEIEVRLEDVDNDSVMEILERREVLEYNGGVTLEEISDSANKYLIFDTIFLTELEFEKEFE
jgi:hypothetical protein